MSMRVTEGLEQHQQQCGLYQTPVVKRRLSWEAKLSVYQLSYIPTLTDGL